MDGPTCCYREAPRGAGEARSSRKLCAREARDRRWEMEELAGLLIGLPWPRAAGKLVASRLKSNIELSKSSWLRDTMRMHGPRHSFHRQDCGASVFSRDAWIRSGHRGEFRGRSKRTLGRRRLAVGGGVVRTGRRNVGRFSLEVLLSCMINSMPSM